MKRILLVLLAVCLIFPAALGEEDEWYEEWDDGSWRDLWEEEGYFEFCSVLDDTLFLFDGVTAVGEARTHEWDDELQTFVDTEPKFENGPWFSSDDGSRFQRVSLPSSLRYIGAMAFLFYHFDEFTLPARLEVLDRDAFYCCGFDVFRIEATVPAEDIVNSLSSDTYCTVYAFETPEDHPLYKAVDGVLFSRDGKTLIAYPNGKTDAHYDVPAGVEHIGNGAFCNEYLTTVSLPVGLKTIGDLGFAGCTRLQSLAVPLTVSEIGQYVFGDCVSLELLSLPEGVTADRDDWAEYYPDDAIYRGDNGDTLYGRRSMGRLFRAGVLAGNGSVKLYGSPEGTEPVLTLESGKTVFLGVYQNGRAAVYDPAGPLPEYSRYHMDYYYFDSVKSDNHLGWADLTDVVFLSRENQD